MDWSGLVHALNGTLPSPSPADEPALEVVLGNTTFVLEHLGESHSVLALGVLAELPPEGQPAPEALLHLLKENMDLHHSGLGSLSYDTVENEIVWQKRWLMDPHHSDEVIQALHTIDTFRADLISRLEEQGWQAANKRLHDPLALLEELAAL